MAKADDKDRKQRQAVALGYERKAMEAPQVLAKGRGRVAEKILEMAREYKIPVERDPVLVEALGQIEIGQEIPPDLYQVVAEILAFIIQTDRSAKKGAGF